MPETTVATTPPLPEPQPVAKLTVCSVCGESWEEHGEKPTLLDCIRLLKARTRNSITWNGAIKCGDAWNGTWTTFTPPAQTWT